MDNICMDCGMSNTATARFCRGCGSPLGKDVQSGGKEDDEAVILDGRYQILELLGKGGMGAVYKAIHIDLGKIYAIKEIIFDHLNNRKLKEYALERFREEARLLSHLSHPGLPQVVDFFTQKKVQYKGFTPKHIVKEDKSRYFLVMSYIEGENLQKIMDEREQEPIAQEDVIDIFIQIADILTYLHSQEPTVIYRDMKPSNIMITEEGKAYLVDFGIVKRMESHVKGTLVGTRGYSAPEQYKGTTDERSDIFSLGVTFHYLLTGKNPADPNSPPYMFPRIKDFNDAVAPSLENLISRMIKIKPSQRPTDMGEVKSLLMNIKREIETPPQKRDDKETSPQEQEKKVEEEKSPSPVDTQAPTLNIRDEEPEQKNTRKAIRIIKDFEKPPGDSGSIDRRPLLKRKWEKNSAIIEEPGNNPSVFPSEEPSPGIEKESPMKGEGTHEVVIPGAKKLSVGMEKEYPQPGGVQNNVTPPEKPWSGMDHRPDAKGREAENPLGKKFSKGDKKDSPLRERKKKNFSLSPIAKIPDISEKIPTPSEKAVPPPLESSPAPTPVPPVLSDEEWEKELKDLSPPPAVTSVSPFFRVFPVVLTLLVLSLFALWWFNWSGSAEKRGLFSISTGVSPSSSPSSSDSPLVWTPDPYSIVTVSPVSPSSANTEGTPYPGISPSMIEGSPTAVKPSPGYPQPTATQTPIKPIATSTPITPQVTQTPTKTTTTQPPVKPGASWTISPSPYPTAHYPQASPTKLPGLDPRLAFKTPANPSNTGTEPKTKKEKWEFVCQVGQHEGLISSLAFLHQKGEGLRLASAGWDGVVKIWDPERGKCLKILSSPDGNSKILSMAISPRRKQIVTGRENKTLVLWNMNTQTGKVLGGHKGAITGVTYSTNEKHIFSGSTDGLIKIWDAEFERNMTTISSQSGISSVAVCPNKPMLATGGGDTIIRLWTAKGEKFASDNSLMGHSDVPVSLVFTPDGNRLVSGSQDGTVKIWDITPGQGDKNIRSCITLPGHTSSVRCVAVSPDGKRILSCGDDKTVRVWDAERGKSLYTIQDNDYPTEFYAVAFSPDGNYFAVGGADGIIRLFRRVKQEE